VSHSEDGRGDVTNTPGEDGGGDEKNAGVSYIGKNKSKLGEPPAVNCQGRRVLGGGLSRRSEKRRSPRWGGSTRGGGRNRRSFEDYKKKKPEKEREAKGNNRIGGQGLQVLGTYRKKGGPRPR